MKSKILVVVLFSLFLFPVYSQSIINWIDDSDKLTPEASFNNKLFLLKPDTSTRNRIEIYSGSALSNRLRYARFGIFRQYTNSAESEYLQLGFLYSIPGATYLLRGTTSTASGARHVFEFLDSGLLILGNVSYSSNDLMLDVKGKAEIHNSLQIGGGALPTGYRLAVKDGIITEKLKVAVSGTSEWSDYVFAKDYRLMPLEEVEKFVSENKHLPNVPSALEVVESGIDVAKMDAKLLEKIEELTLYLIQLKKENDALKNEVEAIKGKL